MELAMSEQEELKACPFCGARGSIEYHNFFRQVICHNCWARGPKLPDLEFSEFGSPSNPGGGFELWNHRAKQDR